MIKTRQSAMTDAQLKTEGEQAIAAYEQARIARVMADIDYEVAAGRYDEWVTEMKARRP